MVMMDGFTSAIRRLLVPLATAAPVPVFAIEGVNVPGHVDDLRCADHVRLVDSPRSASVLLVAGRLPAALHDSARRVHDMMSHPRAAVWLRSSADASAAAPFPVAVILERADDLVASIRQIQRELLTNGRASDAPLLPDEDPVPWRGVGPYGQGGMGMTGGVPYGRPLAERAPDRDGLELDQLPVRVGPFFPPFPSGMTLEIRLQGDVVQEVTVGENPFASEYVAEGRDAQTAAAKDPFRRALSEPVPIKDLELARARHHLRWLAHALRVQGLEALGRRVLASVPTVEPKNAGEVLALRRLLERTGTFGWSTAGVGITDRQQLIGRGFGTVARAAGLSEDARLSDPDYSALSFEPVVHADGDVRARWRQRFCEILQSLDLVVRAGDRRAGGVGIVEAPRGLLRPGEGPNTGLLGLLPGLLRGMEWSNAVTTTVSLDVDLRDMPAGESAPERDREPTLPGPEQ